MAKKRRAVRRKKAAIRKPRKTDSEYLRALLQSVAEKDAQIAAMTARDQMKVIESVRLVLQFLRGVYP